MRPTVAALTAIAITGSLWRSGHAQGNTPLVPLMSWDVIEADSGGRTVYVKNTTQQAITITGVVITRCENIRQLCGEHPANLVVPPGKTMVAFRIQRISRLEGWSWGYSIQTRHEAPPPQSAPPMPGMVIGPNGVRSAVMPISVDSFTAAVPPFTSNAACGRIRPGDLPEGHQALIMVFGTADKPAARRVAVRYNSSGMAYDYSDIRTDLASDTLETMVQLDLVREVGLLRNTRGATSEWFHVSGGKLVDAEPLGHPSDLIARVLKECGGK